MNQQAWDKIVQSIREKGRDVFGIEVFERADGHPDGGETYTVMAGDGKRHNIYSSTKSVTGLAVGMAFDRGLLAPDSPVSPYFPELADLPAEQRERFAGVTVRHLLTMSLTGMPFQVEGENWLKTALSQPVRPDEPSFAYSNQTAYLAGVLASRALGEDLGTFLERELFTPLGIDRPKMARSPEGLFYGASKMRLTVSELARVGRVYLGYGEAFGHRFVSERFVREAMTVHQDNGEGGYGYYLWKRGPAMVIEGVFGQRVILLPEQGKMASMLAHMDENDAVDLTEEMIGALLA